MTSVEIEQSGYEYGSELAAALVLASSQVETDLEIKRQMAQIVLREIEASVVTLRRDPAPLVLVSRLRAGLPRPVCATSSSGALRRRP